MATCPGTIEDLRLRMPPRRRDGDRIGWTLPEGIGVPVEGGISGHRSSGLDGGPAMPLYEFRCKKCSKTFDDKETFAEHDKHPQVSCPHCGSTDVEPVMMPVEVKTSKKS